MPLCHVRDIRTWAHTCQVFRTLRSRTWASIVQGVVAATAGRVLRDALGEGQPKRTIARMLAGPEADLAEIERWRAVVVRAERGGEPNEEQAARVGEAFGVEVVLPNRSTTTRRDQLRRLEEVEDALEALGPDLRHLADRVAELERLVQSKSHGDGEVEGQQ